jgi:hypothetical protein
VTWLGRKKHLEGARTILAKADPEGGPPQADRSMVGPTRPPPPPALLLECSSAAYEKQSKLYIRSVGSYGGKAPPQDYINRPNDPRVGEQLILDHQCPPEIEALD